MAKTSSSSQLTVTALLPCSCSPSPIFFNSLILLNILHYLHPTDVAACSLVCFEWSQIFGPLTWSSFQFHYRHYERILADPKMVQRFVKRARTVREVTIQGMYYLFPLLKFLDDHNRQLLVLKELLRNNLQERRQREKNQLLRDGINNNNSSSQEPPPAQALLFKDQLTRLEFQEWGPRPLELAYYESPNRFVMEELVRRNKNTLQSIEFSLHLQSVYTDNGIHQSISHLLIQFWQPLACLTSLVLRGPNVNLTVYTVFRIFATVPEQLQVLKVEHPVYTIAPYAPYRQPWGLGRFVTSVDHTPYGPPFLWTEKSLPLNLCIRLNCACLEDLDCIWPMAIPTQIRVLSLPEITDNERFRPILTPFLRYRCPKLQTLKLKSLGSTSMELLRPSLGADLFPDLRHLEVDGIRKNMATIYNNMFPIYDLLFKETFRTLESITVSADSDLVDDVPQFVNMILERHASTLKTLRWLGSGGGFEPHERLNLEWFLYACPTLERAELSKSNRFCSSGQAAVGTVIIYDHSPTPSPKLPPLLQKLALSTTPWACTKTLTYLDISFRPSAEIIDEEQYMNQIVSFYKKLGQLIALVELHLGTPGDAEGDGDSDSEGAVVDLLIKASLQGQYNANDEDQDMEKVQDSAVTTPTPIPSLTLPTPDNPTTSLPPPTPSTILDMSLASGLAHLSTLHNLQILNISRIQGHNIQEPELAWMKTHWSKSFKLLQGYKKRWIDSV
ncbi:hypothetical protein BGZ95_002313 [Linnemannia exigua]|uniref:F-box domain-containing protein n=1 Tax=Linnemannia exigua TaxID=604196 RepID=A0AAD4H9Y1_9FUNG|nr:hypothetical protein BGZ95_002313 [Linnemannia exigua]